MFNKDEGTYISVAEQFWGKQFIASISNFVVQSDFPHCEVGVRVKYERFPWKWVGMGLMRKHFWGRKVDRKWSLSISRVDWEHFIQCFSNQHDSLQKHLRTWFHYVSIRKWLQNNLSYYTFDKLAECYPPCDTNERSASERIFQFQNESHCRPLDDGTIFRCYSSFTGKWVLVLRFCYNSGTLLQMIVSYHV